MTAPRPHRCADALRATLADPTADTDSPLTAAGPGIEGRKMRHACDLCRRSRPPTRPHRRRARPPPSGLPRSRLTHRGRAPRVLPVPNPARPGPPPSNDRSATQRPRRREPTRTTTRSGLFSDELTTAADHVTTTGGGGTADLPGAAIYREDRALRQ